MATRKRTVKVEKPQVEENDVKVQEDKASVEAEKVQVKGKSEKLPTWRKIGGGVFGLKGKRYEKGQTFQAKEEDIPKAFRDLVERV